ncbi:MAG: glucokinase [Reyranella sp.]|mgnify:CR=1 FL=1|jgi:glucokinase|uniref:glucokinase n=1 Tax=Reyranella sp. TaxID=1929291 RepID=UPI00095C8CBF|nr:glucokinase [Reyranella sp.]MBN9539462.1 glucokinase [Alphaproteobacteria bacterium]MBR2814343.1 glucokinase [Reyranella sp.]OJU46816.1 MAG: glucokinase [Alphaproteobacteria bacterium 65-37]
MTTSPASSILADIGATNARFALLVDSAIVVSETYAVADYASPIEAARAFLAGPATGHAPTQALIAAAGPVERGRIALTNAAWVVDPERIRDGLNLADVQVLNDFEALGWALPALRPDDIATLGPPSAAGAGTMAVMGPGSGFGLAAMAFGMTGEAVLVTEGGHATLSSENRREDTILVALRKQLHHVSIERVLSGSGLMHLFHAIARVDGKTVPERDSSEIVAHALAGDCDVSRETLELFCAFLGSAAGNIALTLGARGGVFIAGGIAPRFVDFLRRSAFRERFEAKGRMSTYLAQIPTAVIVHATPAFIGLAHLAKVRSRPSARDHAW